MFKRISGFAALIMALMITSCENPPASEKEPAKGDALTIDTIVREPKITSTDSIATVLAAAAAVPDDSVFNDGTQPTSWQNAGFNDPAMVKQFIRKLQGWVVAKQVDSIASHIAFPLKNPAVRDAAQLRAKFDQYFTPAVQGALADQKLNQVFRNQQGAMIGQGQIWLTERNNNILIIAINN